jgi:hypothetical protein
MNRYKITVRGLAVELRGYIDQGIDEDQPTLVEFAEAMKPFGLVVASPIDNDYNPFMIQGIPAETVWEMQAQIIQGERALREKAEAELRDRELHHFETEQILEEIKAALSGHPECDVHDDDDPITCGWKGAVASIQRVLERHDGDRRKGDPGAREDRPARKDSGAKA